MAEKLSNRALRVIQNRPRRKVQVFLFCLVISVFIWFTRELSNDYTTTLNVPIHYMDIPEQLMLYGENPTTLSVTITSAGFDVFGQSVLGRVGDVNVSLAHLQGPGVTSFDELFLQAQIASAISSDAKLISFAPKQISLDIARMALKKIPVRPNVSATINDPYFLLGDPIANPDSIEIEGPQPILDSLKFAATHMAEFANINEAQTQKVKLALHDEIKCKIREVDVTIQLDQWTEKTLSVPIHVVLQNSELQMKTFPDSAKVTCQLGLSEFESISADEFKVEVREYTVPELEEEYKVFLDLVQQPSKIRNTRVDPESVEFILRSKK